MASPENRVEDRHEIISIENDPGMHRKIILTNKMKIHLISVPTCSKACVALDVYYGYLSGRVNFGGLPELCQRMVIVRNMRDNNRHKKFREFLNAHGGSFDTEIFAIHSTFSFDINTEELEKALEYFVDFFQKLDLDNEYILEEIENMNKEFEKILQNDESRLEYFMKYIIEAEVLSNYNETVRNMGRIFDINLKSHHDIKKHLIEFFNEYYSSNVMSLCICSNDTLYQLEKMAVNIFGRIRNKRIEEIDRHYTDDDQFFYYKWRKWFIVPINDIRTLHVTFPFDRITDNFSIKVMKLICFFVEQRGKGSLLSYLKKKDWCTDLTTSCKSEITLYIRFTFQLTETGLSHVDDIIESFLQYIEIFKINTDEEKTTANNDMMKWLYKVYPYLINEGMYYNKEEVMKIARMTHRNKQDETYQIFGHTIPEFQFMLRQILRTTNIMVYVLAKEYENIAQDIGPMAINLKYKIKYKQEGITIEVSKRWINRIVNPEFHIPSFETLEKMLNSNTKFEEINLNVNKLNEDYPIKIQETPFTRLWYKCKSFRTSSVKIFFQFLSPYIDKNFINSALNHIFVQLLKRTLEQEMKKDRRLQMWSITDSKDGILIQIHGSTAYKQFKNMFITMLNLEVCPHMFEDVKKEYMAEVERFTKCEPMEQAIYHLSLHVIENLWTMETLLTADCITIDQMKKFIPEFFRKMYTECLIIGDIPIEYALDIVRLVQDKLEEIHNVEACQEKDLQLVNEIKLQSEKTILSETKDNNRELSCVIIYYQINADSIKTNVLLEIVNHIISQRCFLEMYERSVDKMSVQIHERNFKRGLMITMQSKNDPRVIQNRIEQFVSDMRTSIFNMKEEKFYYYKEYVSRSQFIKMGSNSISKEFWKKILNRQYDFDEIFSRENCLINITRLELLNFYKDIVKEIPKLCLHIVPKAISKRLCLATSKMYYKKEEDELWKLLDHEG